MAGMGGMATVGNVGMAGSGGSNPGFGKVGMVGRVEQKLYLDLRLQQPWLPIIEVAVVGEREIESESRKNEGEDGGHPGPGIADVGSATSGSWIRGQW
ncbi:hypothetical protein NL676_038899 [Syzygium grande]|nr:hypothetical protein NL676_038899 [Syzygium grande]